MRDSMAILTVLSLLAVAAASRADQPLDQAEQCLLAGDTGRAVELYQQANADLPTVEGCNNVGVALERCGRFSDAAVAYGESLRLPEPASETETNLWRVRLRALIQLGLPYAACMFGGLLTLFAAVPLTKRLARVWRAWRYRMMFRGVRAVSLTHRVQCHDGQYQPDGKVYPDSESIPLKAELVLPQRRDIYPLHLELEINRPDGAVWRTLREAIEAREAERVTVWFQLDEVGELLMHSGTWKARLVLRNIDKDLAATPFAVVTRADLVADLEAVDVRLIAVQADRAAPEEVVFPDVEALVPMAVIRPRSCHPSKFTGMRLRLDLVNVDKGDESESQEFPLELTDGAMEFCSVSRRVAGDEIARKLGRWEFHLSAEGRQLAHMPFVITSIEQALESLKVESLEIARVAQTGRPASVGKVVYVRNLRALCPVVTVTTKFPSPRVGFQTTMGVCVDGEPVGGVETKLIMPYRSVELVPGEFTPPRIPEGRDSIRVGFVFMVEGRTLAIREVTLRHTPPRCADAQGRITGPLSTSEIDYEEEAARILGTARVAG